MQIYENIAARLNYINKFNTPTNLGELYTQRYINLLDLSNSNPTVGAIVKRDAFSDVKFFENNKTVQFLESILKNNIATLYPKTRKLREYIVEDNRISLNFIKKCKGYNWLDKLKILMK